MARRNPLNERNINKDAKTGSTRKSAASAKPVRKAADTVYVKSAGSSKSKPLSKAEKKEQRKKDTERENKVYAASTAMTKATPEYSKYKKIWWGILILAIVATVVAWIMQLNRESFGEVGMIVALVVAYAAIIFALILDFWKVRPIRKEMRKKAASMSEKQLDNIIEQEVLKNQKKKLKKKFSKKDEAPSKEEQEQLEKIESLQEKAKDREERLNKNTDTQVVKRDMSRINSYRKGSHK